MLKGEATGHSVAENLSHESVTGQLQIACHKRPEVLLLGIRTRLREAQAPKIRLVHLGHLDGPEHNVREDFVLK
jgi:hypothetical protein